MGLCDVEVMPLGVGRWMAQQKLIRRVRTRVRDWKRESERVRVILNRVHETSRAGVDFEDALAFVAGQQCLDGISFLATNPFRLGEGARGGGIATFEEIAVGVAGVGAGDDFGVAFDFGSDGELDVDELQVFNADEAGVIVDELDIVFEIGRAGAGEG